MINQDVSKAIEKQRHFFNTHQTKEIRVRKDSLKELRHAILEHEKNIADALYLDLRKSTFESYETEIGLSLLELRIHLKNLTKWAKPKKVKTPLAHFLSKSIIYPEPYGVVLIIAPWNYPFQLLINPLIGAISAGNCVVLKPSEYAKYTADVIEQIIRKHFSPEYIALFKGGKEVSDALIHEPVDYIFFTGSPKTGKIVMNAASKNLTPVTLELGGKSPCIVHRDANINLAAKRIVWGKFLNAGQTCVAPDYLFVHQEIKRELLESMKKYIIQFFGSEPEKCEHFPRIINEKHFDRLARLMEDGKIYFGGNKERSRKFISPTIIDTVSAEDPIMQEEIFGPLLPVMEFEQLDEVIHFVNSRPKPLALYFFSTDRKNQLEIVKKTSSGGMCINDTLVHFANPYLPFGGVGNSGMGCYHGKSSFDTFTHYRAIAKKSNLLDVPVRYAPYKGKMKFLKMFLR